MANFGWSYPPGCSGTPYDDEPDWVDEAQKYLKRTKPNDADTGYMYCMIEGLLEIMKDEGVI